MFLNSFTMSIGDNIWFLKYSVMRGQRDRHQHDDEIVHYFFGGDIYSLSVRRLDTKPDIVCNRHCRHQRTASVPVSVWELFLRHYVGSLRSGRHAVS